MTAITQALRTALLDFVWQGLAVAVVLWLALHLMRMRTAHARYLAGCTALAILAATPIVTAYMVYRAPTAETGVPTADVTPGVTSAGAGTVLMNSVTVGWMVRVEPWVLPLWSVGVLFFSLRMAWGCWRVSVLRKRSRQAEAAVLSVVADLAKRMGLARPVRVLTAAISDGPSVAGWVRPVLLLPPATLLGLTPEQLEAILAHELAHIRRYDHVVNAAQTFVETLLFYHPAVWWTSARIREERELCCDDLAVRACGDPLCFARALTKLERLRVITPAAALGSTGGPLMYRVRRLIGVAHQEYAPSKLSGIVALSLALACLAINVPRTHAQTVTFRAPFHPNEESGVTVDLGGAALLHRSNVEYPEAAMKAGIQGTVSVQVSLDAGGNVSDAHVVSGPMELRKAVMTSIFDWHFGQDAAGSLRTVNVTFQKPPAEALAVQAEVTEEKAKPVQGILIGVEQGQPAKVWTVGNLTVSPRTRTFTSDTTKSLEDQLKEARATLEETQDVAGRRESEEKVRALEMQYEMVRGRDAQARAETEPASGGQETVGLGVTGPEYRVSEQERRAFLRLQEPPPMVEGRSLTNFEISGLSDAARSDLVSRLPVHIGDTLSQSSLEAVQAAIRKFDEHLIWRTILRHDGGTTIFIEAPGGSVEKRK